MEKSEDQNKEEGRKSCCGRHCCCIGKVFAAFVLMLIGGIVGFLMGHCSYRRGMGAYGMMQGCPMSDASAAPQSGAQK